MQVGTWICLDLARLVMFVGWAKGLAGWGEVWYVGGPDMHSNAQAPDQTAQALHKQCTGNAPPAPDATRSRFSRVPLSCVLVGFTLRFYCIVHIVQTQFTFHMAVDSFGHRGNRQTVVISFSPVYCQRRTIQY